ncbi:hypothetical protein [Bacillus sp. NPDC077027]|uniref:hypothetical protein n=1 Tax=Bacillus sp. NPDC077027 TaxID=3390548 RepID=UPI003D036BB8
MVYKYDDELNYKPGEEIMIGEDQEVPAGFMEVLPPIGSYLAKYNNHTREWTESATQEYIDSLKTIPVLSDTDLLKQQNVILTKQLTQLSKDSTEAQMREAQMAKQLAQLMTERKKGGEAQ